MSKNIKKLLKDWKNRWNRFVCEELYHLNFYTGTRGNDYLGFQDSSGVFSNKIFNASPIENFGRYYYMNIDDRYFTIDFGSFQEDDSAYSIGNPLKEMISSIACNSIKYINGNFTYGIGYKLTTMLFTELDNTNENKNNSKITGRNFNYKSCNYIRNVRIYKDGVLKPLDVSFVRLNKRVLDLNNFDNYEGFVYYDNVKYAKCFS